MKSLKTPLSIALFLACAWTSPTYAADAKAGAQVAENCIGCHGTNGKSSNPQAPHLAAQSADYLTTQLRAFKAGNRKNATMQAIVADLAEADFDNVAAYFAQQTPAKSEADAALAKVGESKAAMCLGCHGSKAEGRGGFPRLAGQQPGYLAQQLQNFKDGSRVGGPMSGIASGLSDEDIKSIVAYLSSL